MAKKAVILGCGFAGIHAAGTLAHFARRTNSLDVWVIGNQNYFLFTPLLPEIASSRVDPRHIAQPIRDLRGRRAFRFLRADVLRADVERRVVETSEGALNYDYLIVAPGSQTNYFGIPGAREYSWDFKSLEDAVVLRERVLDLCEHADHTADVGARRRLLTFVIAGGGYTGIEIITELHDFLFGYVVSHYRGIAAGDIRLVVLETAPQVLRGVHPKLAEHSMRLLQRKGIEIRTNSPVVRCAPDGVELRGGEFISSSTVIWSAGVRAHDLIQSLPGPHDRVGRAVVNEWLQLEGHPEVFVAGDSAAAVNAPGAPLVAPVAITQGDLAGRNLIHVERGEPLESYRYVSKGMLVSLGMNYAVVNIGKIRFSGYLAWLFWNAIHLFKIVGPKKQLQVAIDWILASVFPRDAMIIRRPRRCPLCEPEKALSAGQSPR
jgi:NADH dehydrogenase